MQGLSGELQTLQNLAMFRAGATIYGITQKRVADGRHVDAHLMRAAGFKLAFHERRLLQCFHQPPMGDRPFAAPDADNGDLLPVCRRSRKIGVYRA